MIDTVILAVSQGNLTARDVDTKGRPMWDGGTRGKGYETFYRDPSKEERGSEHYFPQITGVNNMSKKHGVTSRIKIQFSVPKLLYGNNVDEVVDADFDVVLSVLQSRLSMMGIDLTAKEIRNAKIMRVDYSKNVLLGKRAPITGVMKELEKLMVRRGVDVSYTHYRNGGQGLKATASQHSFTFYDKVAELSKKTGRGKKWQQAQTRLAARLRGQNILRFEVQLTARVKLNAVFARHGFGMNPAFSDVFSSQKSQTILRDYWDAATLNWRGVIFGPKRSAKHVLYKVLATHPAKAAEAIELVGLIMLARNCGGMRELRIVLDAFVNARTWSRFARKFNTTAPRLRGMRADEWFKKMTASLKSYQPFYVTSRRGYGVKLKKTQ